MLVPAVCHVHSLWSYDGTRSLEALAEDFAGRGYRVVLMSEHDKGFTQAKFDEFRQACARVTSSRLLVVPGMEYSDVENTVHVLVWGRIPFLGERLPTNALLKAVRAAGGLAVLAHPSRRQAWQRVEPHWADELLGVETWNRKYDGWAPSRTAPALVAGSRTIPFVGLDFHDARQFFPLTMMLDIEGEVAEDGALAALAAGRCHARAFGIALNPAVLKGAIPVLSTMESSRRTVARLTKRFRAALA